MPRSWQEIYAEIVRLPASARLRLVARLLADLAAEAESSAAPAPPTREPASRSPDPALPKEPEAASPSRAPERLHRPEPPPAGATAPPAQRPATRTALTDGVVSDMAGPAHVLLCC